MNEFESVLARWMNLEPIIQVESENELTLSFLTLCNTVDCSLSGSSNHGIFQAKVLEWIAFSFSRGSSQPRDWTRVSCIAGRCFILWATGELRFKLPRCLHLSMCVCILPSSIYLSIYPSIHPTIVSLSIHLYIPDGVPPYPALLRKSQLCLNSHSLGGDWRPVGVFPCCRIMGKHRGQNQGAESHGLNPVWWPWANSLPRTSGSFSWNLSSTELLGMCILWFILSDSILMPENSHVSFNDWHLNRLHEK